MLDSTPADEGPFLGELKVRCQDGFPNLDGLFLVPGGRSVDLVRSPDQTATLQDLDPT
jgi:hypothetical protein